MIAYCAPLFLFLVMTSFESQAFAEPYYPWVYAGKIALVGGCWWYFRKSCPRFSREGLGLAVLAGLVGTAVWIALATWRPEAGLDPLLSSWLPSGTAARAAFDPFQIANPLGRFAFLAVRLFGLAIVVPLMEEVFWRGFLLRYIINDRFDTVPLGTYSAGSFWGVTILFTLVHPELSAAFVWGAGINLLFYRTRNLWACIVAHSATNLALGIYILSTGSWQLW